VVVHDVIASHSDSHTEDLEHHRIGIIVDVDIDTADTTELVDAILMMNLREQHRSLLPDMEAKY
jgi:hypothetical protein